MHEVANTADVEKLKFFSYTFFVVLIFMAFFYKLRLHLLKDINFFSKRALKGVKTFLMSFSWSLHLYFDHKFQSCRFNTNCMFGSVRCLLSAQIKTENFKNHIAYRFPKYVKSVLNFLFIFIFIFLLINACIYSHFSVDSILFSFLFALKSAKCWQWNLNLISSNSIISLNLFKITFKWLR